MKSRTLLIVWPVLVLVAMLAGCGGGNSSPAAIAESPVDISIVFPVRGTRGIVDVKQIRVTVTDGSSSIGDPKAYDYTGEGTMTLNLQVSAGMRMFQVDALRADGAVEFTGKSDLVSVPLADGVKVLITLQPPATGVDVVGIIHEITGPPSIEITDVPDYGTWGIPLKGKVKNVLPDTAKVLVFIKVRGGWWVKPYTASPFTAIGTDGTWTCSITTGGVDEEATEIRAYLVSKDYSGYVFPPATPPTDMVWDLATVTRTP